MKHYWTVTASGASSLDNVTGEYRYNTFIIVKTSKPTPELTSVEVYLQESWITRTGKGLGLINLRKVAAHCDDKCLLESLQTIVDIVEIKKSTPLKSLKDILRRKDSNNKYEKVCEETFTDLGIYEYLSMEYSTQSARGYLLDLTKAGGSNWDVISKNKFYGFLRLEDIFSCKYNLVHGTFSIIARVALHFGITQLMITTSSNNKQTYLMEKIANMKVPICDLTGNIIEMTPLRKLRL